MNVNGKRCTRCDEWKALERYPKRARRADGRESRCRECSNASLRESRQNRRDLLAEGAEVEHGTVNAYSSYGCRCDPCREAKREESRRFYETNRASRLAATMRWRAKDPDRHLATNRDWYRRNGDHARKVKARAQHRRITRARLRGDERLHAEWEWLRLLRRHGGRCAYCDAQGVMTRDHVIPVSRGGTDTIGNILPACQSCNYSKKDRLLVEWRRSSK